MPRRLHRVAVAGIAATAAIASACGGMSREDYIEELTRDGEVSDEVAECMYREVAGDVAVLDDIESNGAANVSDSSVDTLAVAFAKCYIENPDGSADGEPDAGGEADTGR